MKWEASYLCLLLSFILVLFYKIVVNMGTVYKRDEVILLLEAEMRVLNKVSNSSYVSSVGSVFFPVTMQSYNGNVLI